MAHWLWLWAWLVAASALATGPVWGGEHLQGPAEVDSEASPAAELVIQGFYLEEFEEEGKRMDLWAERASYSRQEDRFYLQGVRILGAPVEGNGSKRFELTGKEGIYDLKEQAAEVRGEVRVVSEDGYTLLTEKVHFDYRTRQIRGPGTVLVEGPEGSTQGVGLEADMGKEVVILQERVRTTIHPSAFKRAKEVLR